MDKNQICIVIGGSHAAAQLVAKLRPEGWLGKIIMLSSDSFYPYHRPPLSKAFLAGEKKEEDLLIRSKKYYEENDIEVRLNTTVVGIDKTKKTVQLKNGVILKYDKLAICTGGRVRKLNCAGSKLNNIFYLRDLKDSLAIKKAMQKARKAIVIGGGYIGLEAAASFKKQDLEVKLIEATQRILMRTSADAVATFIAKKFEEKNIVIRTDEMVSSFSGDQTIGQVICNSGNAYEADIVLVGIGILPNVELAKDAGLATNNGILVDEYAQTSHPDIVAAGDCTNHPNFFTRNNLRLESVPNANDQANSAAASICGKQLKYDNLPWFWSDQFDLKIQIAGLSTGYDETVTHKTEKNFSVWYFKSNSLIAVDAINDPISFVVGKKLLSKRISLSIEQLKNTLPNVRNLLKIDFQKG